MAAFCLLYYITDRSAFPGDDTARRKRLSEKIAEAARCGVDYIQLREKDLSTRELESLARDAVQAVRSANAATVLLINSRMDIALAAGADGVHLRSDDVTPEDVKAVWLCSAGAPAREISPRSPVVGVSCRSSAEVTQAAANGADFTVFAPVFGKKDLPIQPVGLPALEQACRAQIPVLALGGITLRNAKSCLAAGAAGIAGIRLFQDNDIAAVVRALR